MTEQEISVYRKYAHKVWLNNIKGGWLEATYEREDFIQEFLLFALENEKQLKDKGLSFITSKFMLEIKYSLDSKDYKLENMTKFSALVEKGSGDEIEYLFGITVDIYPWERDFDCIDYFSNFLYRDNENYRDYFLSYMYGETCVDSVRRQKIRNKLFTHRFEILDILFAGKKISKFEWVRLTAIAKEMTKVQAVKRVYSNNADARRQREKYYKNIEKKRQYHRERAQRKKAEILGAVN